VATRKEKVDAGLFLLIGVLLLGGTIAIVAGVNLERRGDLFLIKIPKSVGALREGSVVKYLGVNVGRVKAVDFPAEDVESVRVSVEITRPSTPIKSGTFATLSSNFLTGETSIELQGGSNEEARLLPGSLVPWRPSTFMRLEDSLPGALEELRRAVESLDALLAEDNRDRVAKLLDDFDRLAVDVRERIGPLAESLAGSGEKLALEAGGLRREVTASIESGVAELKSAAKSVEEVAGRIAGVADGAGATVEGLPALVASARRVADRLDRLLATADGLVDENREGLRRAIVQLEASAREFEKLVGQLRRNPSDLIFSAPPPEHERGERPSGKPAKGGDS
jgi:phospholipid/cholesterol/gamma-HCH transport system substrate-binding protein